jgi:hypothetical protein
MIATKTLAYCGIELIEFCRKGPGRKKKTNREKEGFLFLSSFSLQLGLTLQFNPI